MRKTQPEPSATGPCTAPSTWGLQPPDTERRQMNLSSGEPGGFTSDTAGLNLDQRSPQYHAAQHACQRLATHAKG
jgi:hypothetical protein